MAKMGISFIGIKKEPENSSSRLFFILYDMLFKNPQA